MSSVAQVTKQKLTPSLVTASNQSADLQNSLTAQYRRYSVFRKLPMPLGRHGRTIAVDVDYIHFLPPENNRGVFEAGKTTSYHASAILECRVSKRSKGSFKILVQKDRRVKRYDFEGESARQVGTSLHYLLLIVKLIVIRLVQLRSCLTSTCSSARIASSRSL